MHIRFFFSPAWLLAGTLFITGCSPKFDWREVRGSDAPFTVLLPAKPATHTRPVNIGGTTVSMTMTAAEVDGVTFAVGTASLPNAAAAIAALPAMREALVRNINGKILRETGNAGAPLLGVEARGAHPQGNPQKTLVLHGQFVARDARVYQALVLGPEKQLSREAVDTFYESFKTH